MAEGKIVVGKMTEVKTAVGESRFSPKKFGKDIQLNLVTFDYPYY